jgi:hypothetical protein
MSEFIWIHFARPRPHWYGESDTARAAHLRHWDEIADRSRAAGGVHVGRYHVRGQSDFETVEIWQFSTVEQAFDHWTRLTGAGYAEWFGFANTIGFGEAASP